VKIAPGPDGNLREDARKNNRIRVGWSDVGDLLAFGSKDEFRARFTEVHKYTTTSKTSAKANELWTLRELEPGDLVVANRGGSEVLALGTVVDPAYQYQPERRPGRCRPGRRGAVLGAAGPAAGAPSWALLARPPGRRPGRCWPGRRPG